MNTAQSPTHAGGAGAQVPPSGDGMRGRQPRAEQPDAANGGVVRRTARRSRNLALALASLAMAFYFGFIAITIYRSHH